MLIVGAYNYFSVALISRLKREKHNTYILCGKAQEDSFHYKQKADVEYPFDPSDHSVLHIIGDIQPDIVIFMGGFDSTYNWDLAKSVSGKYLSTLSNILDISCESVPRKFIYLSLNLNTLQDQPLSTKEITVSTGENICETYEKNNFFPVCILRFSSVYGLPEYDSEDCGELSNALMAALAGRQSPTPNRAIFPLYVSDAIEVIYKIIQATAVNDTIYNIHGRYEINLSSMREMIENASKEELWNGNVEYGECLKELEEIPEFNSEFSFKPIVPPDTGIQYVINDVIENKLLDQKIDKKSTNMSLIKTFKGFLGKMNNAYSMIFPFIENVLLFVLVTFIINKGYPSPEQLLIFYIVFVSAFLNRAQVFISLVLSVVYYTLIHSDDYSLYQIVTEYEYLCTILVMFISGFMVSSIKDRLTTIEKDKDFIIDTQDKQISELIGMLDTNRDIKAELESRLLNNSDNLSRIYEIISRLDAVETRRVFNGALKAVSDIMRSKDISIYVSGNNSSYFRLVASSTDKARKSMSTSIKITDYAEMYEALKTENVYVNRSLKEELPAMALAISTGGEFNVVIMLWTIDFKDLGIYHVNLFLVLRMIITNSITRAYQYETATHAQRYIDDTEILRKEFFEEVLEDQKKIQEDTQMPYQLLRLTSKWNNLAEVSANLSRQLRDTDYIGIGSDDSIMIVLGGTGKNDVQFVINRLEGIGLQVESVEL